jgi:hypothetical protein
LQREEAIAMTERRVGEAILHSGTGMGVKRRGILATMGAVIAGIVAKGTSQPVRAASDTNFVAHNGTGTAFHNDTATYDTGIAVSGASIGVSAVGIALTSTGVTAVGGTGVAGFGSGGNATEVGVHGQCQLGTGVQGLIPNTSGAGNTIAVQGLNQSSGAGGIGVSGSVSGPSGIGVQGTAGSNGVGVFGTASGNTAVLGITTAPGFAGLGGIANVTGTAAFAGTSTNPNAFAGFFTGDVFVNGNFTVNDPTRKHGAIQHPDGSHRLLYSMESPESWLEDFGTGQLAGGQSTVTLDPDFAAVTHTEDYLVFLTPRDAECKGLAVAAQSTSGFIVRELNGGTGAAAFYWRVVAKPKSKNKATRMAKFTVPDITVPQPPMPNVSAPLVPESTPRAAPPSRPAGSATTPSAAVQGGVPMPQPTVQPAPPPRP